MYDNLFCKVFIDTDIDYEELFMVVKDHVCGEKEAISYICTNWAEISVKKNKEYFLEKYLLSPDDFLYWKYYLDVQPKNVEQKEYIKKISHLINDLRGYGAKVIAACDFENEL